MKIPSITDAMRTLNSMRIKREGEGGGQSPGYDSPNQEKKQDKSQNEAKEDSGTFEEALQVTDKKVADAVESFATDSQNSSSGLQASLTGNGPGLKVILKDGSGAVVRQFTGEEFVKMREATAKDGRTRGKILDQKI